MALFRGEDSEMAEAGALLLADALITIRGLDGSKLHWPGGRGGL